ncbi:hypothetical protein Tco_1107265 [Tanacetum coccineum]
MHYSIADQIALDDAWVAPATGPTTRLVKCNLHLSSDNTSKEATFKWFMMCLKLTSVLQGFPCLLAEAPKYNMQEFWLLLMFTIVRIEDDDARDDDKKAEDDDDEEMTESDNDGDYDEDNDVEGAKVAGPKQVKMLQMQRIKEMRQSKIPIPILMEEIK